MNREPPRESEPKPQPRVWCGALGAYAEGHLHGEWLDAAVEPDELWLEVHRVLASSPVPHEEEFGWFDNEGFCGIPISEMETVERICTFARLAQEHGEAFGAWLAYTGEKEGDDLAERFQEAYIGIYESGEALAEQLMEEAGAQRQVEEWQLALGGLGMYLKLDAGQYATDLELGGAVYMHQRADGSIYAFWTQ